MPKKHHVVVDGSNLATEGRTSPSLAQLDEAVRAYQATDPGAEMVVVVDASFEHRIEPSERAQLAEAELNGEVVSPPAGAIGRGDAFVLRIAERTGATVLSNDSFQEFHGEHPWLFDEGRLVGGKPVPGVGWIFTPRTPVRGVKSRRATTGKGAKDKTAGIESAVPAPVKAAELAKAAKQTAKQTANKAQPVVAKEVANSPQKKTAKKAAGGPTGRAAAGSPKPQAVSPATNAVATESKKPKGAKPDGAKSNKAKAGKAAADKSGADGAATGGKVTKSGKRVNAERGPRPDKAPKSGKGPKAAKAAHAVGGANSAKSAKAVKQAAVVSSSDGTAKKAAGRQGRSGRQVRAAIKDATAEVLAPEWEPDAKPGKSKTEAKGKKVTKRRRAVPPPAVNDPLAFISFVAAYPIGSTVEGEVGSFTSHGAMVEVELPEGGVLHCYVPLSGLGSPVPNKARQVLSRGERRTFELVGLDAPRRVAELALPGLGSPVGNGRVS